MRLADPAELESFRSEVGDWLDENRPTPGEIAADRQATSGVIPPWCQRWIQAQFEAGLLRPGWPRAFGGREVDATQMVVWFEEYSRRGLVRTTNEQGLDVFAPSVYEHGTDVQRNRFLMPVLHGEASACLGMSEPNAGSDLASLRMRGEVIGDKIVINGQKLWTSGTDAADFMIAFVRTDPNATKHGGISAVLVELKKTPGITIRPVREVIPLPRPDLNEVFFDDVRVPVENVLGRLNGGWSIANGSLGHERLMIWMTEAASNEHILSRLRSTLSSVQGADGRRLADDPVWRQAVAGFLVDNLALVGMGYRSIAKARRGLDAPEQSLLKIFSTETHRRIARSLLDAAGAHGATADEPVIPSPGFEPANRPPFTTYLETFAATISGGSSEIQRNIVAERVLGLPRLNDLGPSAFRRPARTGGLGEESPGP